VPDAPGLELIRSEINDRHTDAVLDTSFDREQAALIADPEQIIDVLRWLRDTPGQSYTFLSSVHVADYLPAEPRFGVHYELLNRNRVERIRVRAALPDPQQSGRHPAAPGREAGSASGPAAPGREAGSASGPAAPGREAEEAAGSDLLPEIDSCVELFPTADFPEREAYDFFGIVFRGHPDLRRILMPEDYVGWPQRRDFPVGGEPVTFTHNEPGSPVQ
jgi:NADH-quinone oxidoreductase subunit C